MALASEVPVTVPTTQLSNSFEYTGDVTQNAIQEELRKTKVAVNGRGSSPNVLEPITFTAGQQIRIAHKLGRKPLEWSVKDVSGGYGSFQRVGEADESFIVIQSQNACTAVFQVA